MHGGVGVLPGRYRGDDLATAAEPTTEEVASEADRAAADRLAGQVCAAAAASAQATSTLLMLIGEFDASGAIPYWTDVKSVAHWLSWSCSMRLGTAREHVRVPRALPQMPTVCAEFAAGRLSYSKVSEVTRVVGVVDESRLCELAKTATAAQLTTMLSAFRSTADQRMSQEARRLVSWTERSDGMVDLRARLTKEDAAVLTAAIQTAKDQFGTPPEPDLTSTGAPQSVDGVGTYTMVDALVDVGRVFLDTAPEDRSGEDRTLVVVHISAELLPATTVQTRTEDGADVPAGTSFEAEPSPTGLLDGEVCHIQGQGSIEPATAQRLACDNPLLTAVTAAGHPLALGRTQRLVSRAQRRALMIRDRMCRYPGCSRTRHLAAHHIRAWADGGPTDLDNLILLCPFHHTTVHEGGLLIRPGCDGWVFTSADGTLRLSVHTDAEQVLDDRALIDELIARRRRREIRIAAVDSFGHPDAEAIRPGWRGEPFSVPDCVEALTRMMPAA